MGKYMKKGKILLLGGGDVAVMEIPKPTSSSASASSGSASVVGVRTRARTLALQPNPELSYLQLRNRRLEKPSFHPPPPSSSAAKVSEGHRRGRVNSDSVGSIPVTRSGRKGHGLKGCFGHLATDAEEGSIGENNLEFDSSERGTRETTPCSLIRNPDAIKTPGSTTRRTCSTAANQRPRNMQRPIPTTSEMEDFFAGFELHQQEQFLQKYNYDIVNDVPISGRYEWVRVDN